MILIWLNLKCYYLRVHCDDIIVDVVILYHCRCRYIVSKLILIINYYVVWHHSLVSYDY